MDSSTLSQIIIDKIQSQGPLSFRDYMEMALYYPGLGYYTSNKDRIGENGDYFTSPHATGIFGAMIARQLEEIWHLLGQDEFRIVEYGGGDGTLARDILRASRANSEFYKKIRYLIVERKIFDNGSSDATDNKLSWYHSAGDIGNIRGIILSNELIDNFPVHRVVMLDELMEVFVDYDQGFVERLFPATKALKDYFNELGLSLPREFKTEVNLSALAWIKEVSEKLDKGFVITIDYGYPAASYYSTIRNEGTISCYHRHRLNNSPYQFIGEQDITFHVNFSALQHWGRQFGLESCGFTSQTQFLRSLGLVDLLRQTESRNYPMNETRKQFFLHEFLQGMGGKLKVLIQQKGIGHATLSGLQLSSVLH